MKLRLCAVVTLNGNPLAPDEFAFTHPSGSPDRTGIVFHCRGNPSRPKHCVVPITRGAQMVDPIRGPVWGWDGNEQAPTLTPSIGCDQRCGWHGHITAGDWTP